MSLLTMKVQTIHHWHRTTLPIYAVLALMVLTVSITAFAAEEDATLELRPECKPEELEEGPFGPIPSPPPLIKLGNGRCYGYEIRDPGTRHTPALKKGDELNMDVVVDNPSDQKISRVRAWISYDPDVLEGVAIEINEDFPTITPGEADFSPSQGYAMIQASSAEGAEPSDRNTVVATVRFRVKETPPAGTVITFYDVKKGGHTEVIVKEDETETNILGEDPGTLLVQFEDDGTGSSSSSSSGATTTTGTEGDSCTENTECESNYCLNSICQAAPENRLNGNECTTNGQCLSGLCTEGICEGNPNGSACTAHGECNSNFCSNGLCQERIVKRANNAACENNVECQSGLCQENICTAKEKKLPNGNVCTENTQCNSNSCKNGFCTALASSTPQDDEERTAFSLLQVRNVRVTTEGSAVYMGWDPLQSSQLAGYNVYYGTTSGRYIQRKSTDAETSSLTVRSLPVGTTYYFAVRAVNQENKESAFSQEVSVTVGDPSSSTAPLVAGSLGSNPLEGSVGETGGQVPVPGETGTSSTIAFFLILSAVIGTVIASRRQMIVLPISNDQSHD